MRSRHLISEKCLATIYKLVPDNLPEAGCNYPESSLGSIITGIGVIKFKASKAGIVTALRPDSTNRTLRRNLIQL
jgi:hypothetical protein